MKIKLGIWVVEEQGISCIHPMHRHSFISNEWINSTMISRNGIVWEFPIHFAHKIWTTEKMIKDLLTALSVKRSLLSIEQCSEIDERTWIMVLSIFNQEFNAA